ncbi:tetratricopeptide repeat protein [Wenyingzhuangia sp. IMCC45574]
MIRGFYIVFFLGIFHFSCFSQNKELDRVLKTINQDIEDSKELTSQAKYPAAYNKLWNVLIVADSLDNSFVKYRAYKHLSQLYSIFHQKEKAFAAIDSMFLCAKKSGLIKKPNVVSSLNYAAALTYRMNGEYNKASSYLEKCEYLLDSLQIPFRKRIYAYTERAHIYTLVGKFKESEELLLRILAQISEEHQYASITNSMLGDLYSKKNESQKALVYFNRCLEILAIQNNRVGLKVDLLEKMSQLNKGLGNYKVSLQQMTASKVLGDSLFGSQSARNKQLFEINNSYQKSILENNQIKREKELQFVKNQKEKLNLQLWFSVFLCIVTLIAAFFGIRLIRKKHQTEKKLAVERANAEVEIKKKELAVTALQLIEKDKLLEEIKKGLDEVKKNKDDSSVEQLKSTIKVNAAKTWEEFETRFVQVNSSFYKSLGKKHSDLSRNELKLCALVKLNFSTKEMSQLLGVSADSVNKARYRLRKKLGLQRDDNLVSYINSI